MANKLYISQHGPMDPAERNTFFCTISASPEKSCDSVLSNGVKDDSFGKTWDGAWLYLDESAQKVWTGETRLHHGLLLGKITNATN